MGGSKSERGEHRRGPYPSPTTTLYGDPRTGLGFPVVRVVLTHATGIGKVSMINGPTPPLSASYAVPLDLRGAHTSDMSVVRSSSEGSSLSGEFTRVEMGHMVIGLDG